MIARLDVWMLHMFALKLDPVEPRVITVSLGPEAGDEMRVFRGQEAQPSHCQTCTRGHLGPFTIRTQSEHFSRIPLSAESS